ncbi:MAG: class I SAM-dependent methyltransferase [Opitutaceae bacterium]
MRNHAGLGPDADVADIGAGTGILTRLLLDANARVHAVEPNAPMREALLAASRDHARLCVRDGSAEATGLPDRSIDLVTAAQAFHWFKPVAARREFARILRPGGHVALIWNTRLDAATPFLTAYEHLLRRRSPDYAAVDHRRVDAALIAPFFAPGPVRTFTFPNEQRFDFDGLRGRLLSSSYAPAAGHPDHEPMLAELRAIFHRHQSAGSISFLYRTELHLGKLLEK